MVTVNLVTGGATGGGGGGFLGSAGGGLGGGGTMGVALIPAWLKSRALGSSRSWPVQETSTVVPALPPQGERVNSRGPGSRVPTCAWAGARPGSSRAAEKASRAAAVVAWVRGDRR